MADEVVVPVVAPVVEAAPVVAAPVVVEAAPVTAPVVAAEAAPVTPEPVKPADTSVIGDALKPVEAPKVEAPEPVVPPVDPNQPVVAETEPKKEGQSDEPAPPPSYESFTIPEGLSLDEARTKEFTDILADLEIKSKADHALFQEFGQKAVDFHVAEMQKTVEALTKANLESWENTKNEWKDTFMKDPELGGNRWQTTVDSAKSFIRTHGGTEAQQAEFRDLMNMSGVGNHPAMIRLLANAGLAMKEGRPLAAQAPASTPKSKVATMYGSNK